jgi:hypothetical protein
MILPMSAKIVGSKPTSPRPDGIMFLGGLAFLAGIVLLVAAITFALPYSDGFANGPALIGVWIMLSFGYFGFGQFLPGLAAPNGIPIIVILAILYLAAGIGFFTRRRWGMDPRHNVGIIWSSVEHSSSHHLVLVRFPWYTWADCDSNDTGLSHDTSRQELLFQTLLSGLSSAV